MAEYEEQEDVRKRMKLTQTWQPKLTMHLSGEDCDVLPLLRLLQLQLVTVVAVEVGVVDGQQPSAKESREKEEVYLLLPSLTEPTRME